MKIAIACRGLIRSPQDNIQIVADKRSLNTKNADWCIENIDILKDSMKHHEVTTFFSSWSVPNSIEMLNRNYFDHYLLMKQPELEEAWNLVPAIPIWFKDPSHPLHKRISLYGFFCQSRAIINFINSIGKEYDYIVATRPDVRIKPTNIDEWLDDRYMVPSLHFTNFNDHFNIASTKVMTDVWVNSWNWDTLPSIVERSNDTEDVVRNLVELSKHNYGVVSNFIEYTWRS